MSSSAVPWYVKLVLRVAIPAACLGALYLSIPGEIAMARTAGWSDHYAPAMPVCVSVYALAAAAIAAFRRKAKLPGQVTALIGAAVALILAMSAQSIAHLIQQSYMGTSAVLVVAVSCVPPIVVAHLMHMAETPSQVKTAEDEKTELRGMIDYLSVELTQSLTSQSVALVSRSAAAVNQFETLAQVAEKQSVEDLIREIEEALRETERDLSENPRRRGNGPKAITQEALERTAERLRQDGEKTTVGNLARALGVSEATFYRLGGRALTA